MITSPIHPDDLVFFNEVSMKMHAVAKTYGLNLRTVSPFPMPEKGLADRLGDCNGSGDIRLVMRATVDGEWCDEPRSPASVWDTAAHELAHLRHMNHALPFQEFRLELVAALENAKEDPKEKLIKKLVKMQKSRDGEAALGNSAAAEAFAGMINKMLLENELEASDLDYQRADTDDPVIELPVNFGTYKIELKKTRLAWQENLARIVAKAHLCTFLIRLKSNQIIFVGTRSHATVAEFAYGTLVPAAEKMSLRARHNYREDLRREHGIPSGTSLKGVDSRGFGFREAWLDAFIDRIGERFAEARTAAVSTAPEGASTALIRLEGALVKARKYTDDKFSGKDASPLSHRGRNHADGRKMGRAAADAMGIGQKGVTGRTGGKNRALLS